MFNHANKYAGALGRCVCAVVLGLFCATAAAQAQSAADLQAVEKDLSSLGGRIQRLQDLTEVEIVQNAYGYYVDKAPQWRGVRCPICLPRTPRWKSAEKAYFWAGSGCSNI